MPKLTEPRCHRRRRSSGCRRRCVGRREGGALPENVRGGHREDGGVRQVRASQKRPRAGSPRKHRGGDLRCVGPRPPRQDAPAYVKGSKETPQLSYVVDEPFNKDSALAFAHCMLAPGSAKFESGNTTGPYAGKTWVGRQCLYPSLERMLSAQRKLDFDLTGATSLQTNSEGVRPLVPGGVSKASS